VHHVSIYAGAGQMLEAPDSAHRVRLVAVRYGGLVGARRYTRS
jgi:cell wall-associated NlpC family hydrolase